MEFDPTNLQWIQSDWLKQSHAWIAESASAGGMQVVGEITQPHVRPWATTMRIPTDRGVIWFKATTSALGHESAITEALSRWVPGRTPNVIAAAPERNWLLMSDGGETLRSLFGSENDAEMFRDLAGEYARLQRAVADHVPEMLALNTPDCRLSRFADLFSALIEQPGAIMVGGEDELTEDEAKRIRSVVPRVDAISQDLANFGIPETIQHDDLHSNNVLMQNGLPLVFDWGDSSLSHPFLSLTLLLRGAARDLKCEIESPAVQDVKNAYLAAWDLQISESELERACVLSDALGRISRALAWNRLIVGLDPEYSALYESYVSGWLKDFLDSPAVGRG